MEDRFKFRFWNKSRKIMETFNNSPLTLGGLLLGKNDNYEILSCTGLKDKNGKLIYEGDICEYEFEEIGKQKAIIEFNTKYATFLIKPLNDFQYANINDCEVIGNIYQNPELLED